MDNVTQQIDTSWFRGRLADRRLSQRQMAKRMGLDPAAVSLMLRGKRKASASEIADIATLLGVSGDEVLAHMGSTPTVPGGRVRPVEMVRDAPKPEIRHRDADVQAVGMLELPVPMSDGSVARLVLPRNLARGDAERIAALVQALAL